MKKVVRDAGLFVEVVSALEVGHVNCLRVLKAVDEAGVGHNLVQYLWTELQAIDRLGPYRQTVSGGYNIMQHADLGELQWKLESDRIGGRVWRTLRLYLNGHCLIFARGDGAYLPVFTPFTIWPKGNLSREKTAELLGLL